MKSTTIKIARLILKNFKGIRSLEITLNENENFINGKNATGKTTVMDACLWLLFDKDSAGRKDFNIKTIDQSGNPIHNLEHEVSADLTINDELVTLRKVYKEKWTKPRGQVETVFSGHETVYYYNDVPLAQRDYAAKIEAICPEKVFKLLTNPLFFPALNWVEQRKTLFEVTPSVSDTEIARTDKAYAELLSRINGSKSLEEYKREIAMKKKRIKDDLDVIPARIDEVQRSLPDTLNWGEIEKIIGVITTSIEHVDSLITDAGKGTEEENNKRLDLQKQKFNLESVKQKILHELSTYINSLKNDYTSKVEVAKQRSKNTQETVDQNNSRIINLEGFIQTLKQQRQRFIEEWHKINAEKLTFNQDTICPTCGQILPDDFLDNKQAEAEAKFNDSKATKLSSNVKSGKQIVFEIQEAERKILACKQVITDAIANTAALGSNMIKEPDYEAEKISFLTNKSIDSVEEEIKKIDATITSFVPSAKTDISGLLENKKAEQVKLDAFKKDLSKRELITAGNQRIEKLKENQQILSQELADFEKVEYTIAAFTRAKIATIEANINAMFRIARFKMYSQQINGGEVETCECTVNGVPYSDLNNAMKINAGLDILSTLAEKYSITAPIFIDNRESINELIPVKSQLINLVVTEDEELVINP